jgi:para-aminobenzoate synthetase component 1
LRVSYTTKINKPLKFKRQLLQWAQQFDEIVWLDSNEFKQHYSEYDAVLAVDALTSMRTDCTDGFARLKEYQSNTQDWIFGYLTYDLKNDTERLVSKNIDKLEFPDLYFFQPKRLFLLKGNRLEMHYLRMLDDEMQHDFNTIQQVEIPSLNEIAIKKALDFEPAVKIKLRIHKEEYHKKVTSMLSHIHRGDIYEANFCQEFYSDDASINPLETYLNLNDLSKPPFASFLKLEDKYAMCASPERYIMKNDTTLISQPIKGTAKRSDNPKTDTALKTALAIDIKERAENIMIVDLVRNDLSKLAKKGSVKVEELCEVYSFKQVHQMISTIVAEVNNDVHPVDTLKATYPMGSMTGAPKISAMKIIEELEETKRGLYSGTIGYFDDKCNFDFNVVIRSILYNASKNYVSYSVGGAITAKSIPEKEYEECLIKAKAMRQVLEG